MSELLVNTIKKADGTGSLSVPAEAEAAEAERQLVRDKYATIQTNIDLAADVNALKAIVDDLGE